MQDVNGRANKRVILIQIRLGNVFFTLRLLRAFNVLL